MPTDTTVDRDLAPDRFETDSAALSRYLDTIGRTPLLDADGEAALAIAARAGDSAAAKALAEANLRLVVHFAARFSRRGVPLRDLIAEGNFGLMRAVQTYEARTGGRFANYAVWWIRRHIMRCVAESKRSIHLPAHRFPMLAEISRVRAAYAERNGRDPSAREIAEVTGFPEDKIHALVATGFGAVSLQTPVAAGETRGASLGDFLADEDAESPADVCSLNASKADLVDLLGHLNAREADIVRARFGLDDGEEKTCDQIGRRYGLTRERVRQIQDVAMRKLRRASEEIGRTRTREEVVAHRRDSARREVFSEFALQVRDKASRTVFRPMLHAQAAPAVA